MVQEKGELRKAVVSFSLDLDVISMLNAVTGRESRSQYVNDILKNHLSEEREEPFLDQANDQEVKSVEKKEVSKEKKIRDKRGRPRKRTEAND